jgi:hypothetical protein
MILNFRVTQNHQWKKEFCLAFKKKYLILLYPYIYGEKKYKYKKMDFLIKIFG